jgi:hypothetical protein
VASNGSEDDKLQVRRVCSKNAIEAASLTPAVASKTIEELDELFDELGMLVPGTREIRKEAAGRICCCDETGNQTFRVLWRLL